MRLLPHTLPRRNSRRHLLDEAPNPGPSALKRCWVIVPDRKLMFDPAGRDVVVKMKRGQVAAATPGNRAA
jgi:hypothetical protein